MKQIDIEDMLQELERELGNLNIFLIRKYKENANKKQPEIFDLFESDYNEITLEKSFVIKIVENIKKKVTDIKNDVSHCGIHLEDFEKASSDFHEYCVKHRKKIDEDMERFGLYQQNLSRQLMANINSKMADAFNDTFTNVGKDKYFKEYKRKKGGSIKHTELFNEIYSEIMNLPLHRLNDSFDEKGHFLGINNIPYDTSNVIRESVRKDIDGNPVFVIEYKRNTYGYFECLRIQIGNKWFVLYEG